MSDLISTQESVVKIVDTAIRKILNGEQKLTKEYEQSVKEAVNVILNTARASAQAEIVRCKDCKWSDWYTSADGKRYCYCMETGNGGRTENDFCSYAERENDG